MKKRLLYLVMILTLVLGMTFTQEGFGASVSAGMSGGSCQVGKTVTVTLTYSGATMGASTINLSYDSSALTLSGQGGNISMANGNTFLLEAMGTSSMSATFTFTAKKAGNYTVTATTTAGETWDQGSFSCGPVSATIKVSEPQSSSGGSSSSGSSGSSSSGSSSSSSSSSSGSNTNSGTPNRRGDFTDEELIKTDTEEEQEEEEPLEKPEQIEVEIGDKTYVICEDITEEDAPAGFKLAKAKYGEWDWEIAVYSDEEGNYVLVCLMVKETEDRQFFRYNEEKGTFNDEIPVSVAEFMEYKNLAAAAAADDGEEENDSILVPVLIGILIVAAAGVIVLQVNIIRKRKNSEEW